MVHFPPLLQCIRICCRPNHFKAFFQQVIVPSNRSNTRKTKSDRLLPPNIVFATYSLFPAAQMWPFQFAFHNTVPLCMISIPHILSHSTLQEQPVLFCRYNSRGLCFLSYRAHHSQPPASSSLIPYLVKIPTPNRCRVTSPPFDMPSMVSFPSGFITTLFVSSRYQA